VGLAALGELGQRFHAQCEMIGLDVKVDTVLVVEPLVKREMSRPIAIFVQPKGAYRSFSQRLRDQPVKRTPQIVSSAGQSRGLGDQHYFFIWSVHG
jgi:hypothetical protein